MGESIDLVEWGFSADGELGDLWPWRAQLCGRGNNVRGGRLLPVLAGFRGKKKEVDKDNIWEYIPK